MLLRVYWLCWPNGFLEHPNVIDIDLHMYMYDQDELNSLCLPLHPTIRKRKKLRTCQPEVVRIAEGPNRSIVTPTKSR